MILPPPSLHIHQSHSIFPPKKNSAQKTTTTDFQPRRRRRRRKEKHLNNANGIDRKCTAIIRLLRRRRRPHPPRLFYTQFRVEKCFYFSTIRRVHNKSIVMLLRFFFCTQAYNSTPPFIHSFIQTNAFNIRIFEKKRENLLLLLPLSFFLCLSSSILLCVVCCVCVCVYILRELRWRRPVNLFSVWQTRRKVLLLLLLISSLLLYRLQSDTHTHGSCVYWLAVEARGRRGAKKHTCPQEQQQQQQQRQDTFSSALVVLRERNLSSSRFFPFLFLFFSPVTCWTRRRHNNNNTNTNKNQQGGVVAFFLLLLLLLLLVVVVVVPCWGADDDTRLCTYAHNNDKPKDSERRNDLGQLMTRLWAVD